MGGNKAGNEEPPSEAMKTRETDVAVEAEIDSFLMFVLLEAHQFRKLWKIIKKTLMTASTTHLIRTLRKG